VRGRRGRREREVKVDDMPAWRSDWVVVDLLLGEWRGRASERGAAGAQGEAAHHLHLPLLHRGHRGSPIITWPADFATPSISFV